MLVKGGTGCSCIWIYLHVSPDCCRWQPVAASVMAWDLSLFKKNKNNVRKSWQVIKDIIGKHKHGPIMSKRFKVNSTEIDDPLIISNRFNEYFVNIRNNLANKINMQPNSYEKYLGGAFQESMFLSPVTKGEINSIISFFGDTASGWDDIAPRSIKFV